MKPIIVLDYYCDLPNEYLQEDDLYVLPNSYVLDGQEHLCFGIEADTVEFYAKVREGFMPTTAQVAVNAYLDLFHKLVAENRPIIYLAFSSGLSGTYSSSCLAREAVLEEFPTADITLIDTLAASMGLGLIAYTVLEMRRNGAEKAEIVDFVETNKLRLNHWFTVDDLNHLKRGGRLSAGAAMVGTMLSIKPVMWVDAEGHLKPVKKERGRLKSIHALANMVGERGENIEGQTLMLSHGDCLDDALLVKKLVMEQYPVKDVLINYVGPGIGAHSGPGTLALFFWGKTRLIQSK